MKNFSILFFVGILACHSQQEKGKIKGSDLKMNEIQVLGTHNSYTKPIDPNVIAFAAPIINTMMSDYMENLPDKKKEEMMENHPNNMSFEEGLNYDHPTFPEQLDAGIRSLEIDVYYDPSGNRFNNPASYSMLRKKGITNLLPHDTLGLGSPGFKVLHVADLDFRSHYPTLKGALEVLKSWSESNPDHIPIYILMEAKDSGMPLFENAAEVLKFDKEAYDALDKEILAVLGRDKIITPDDVQGNYPTLKEAVLNKNWPSLKEAKGKFIFLLLPGSAGTGSTQTPYLTNDNNLKNRVMFTRSTPSDDFGAFLLLDNSIVRQNEIQKFVAKGYLVRTRSDIETYEAKVEDFTRAEAAFSSGAQVISTDFYKPGNIYGTKYFVEIPNAHIYRANPINAGQNKAPK